MSWGQALDTIDAEYVAFTPAVLADWLYSADPGEVADALDQLAGRLTQHAGDYANPHFVDKADVGLSNVTNDAQLKRAGADWLAFTEVTSVGNSDTVLLELGTMPWPKRRALGSKFYRPGKTDVAIADGGTGASDAPTARANLQTEHAVPFMTNVTDPDGNPTVEYETGTVPADKVVASVEYQSGEMTVIIHGEVDGGRTEFTPTVTIEGSNVSGSPVSCSLSVLGTETRRYQFSQAISLTGDGDVSIKTADGGGHTVNFSLAAPPPSITTFTHGTPGEYQPGQTRVKNGDTVSFSATFPAGAKYFVLENFELHGTTAYEYEIDPEDTSINDTFTVAGSDGNPHNIKAHLKMESGAPGDSMESTNSGLYHDSQAPQVGNVTVDNYPSGQTALKDSETADCTCTVSGSQGTDWSSVEYSDNGSNELSIPSPTTYAVTKTVTRISGDYRDEYDGMGNNYRVRVLKSYNGTETNKYGMVRIAHATPVVTVARNTTGDALFRLGIDDGTNGYLDHTVYLNSNQTYHETDPASLTAPKGSWQGSWSTVNQKSKSRALRIADTDFSSGGQASNNYSWSACGVKNKAGRTATTVTTNPNYSLGGFAERTLTIPAYPNREGDIGCLVVDTSKLVCENLSKGGGGPNGGTMFTFDNSPGQGMTPDDELDKFCISDGNDLVDDDNQYWYNKDLPNAMSNTSGTAQVLIEEGA